MSSETWFLGVDVAARETDSRVVTVRQDDIGGRTWQVLACAMDMCSLDVLCSRRSGFDFLFLVC